MLEPSETAQTAFSLFQQGRGVEGEAMLVQAAAGAEAEHGAESPELAAALMDLATLHLAMGERGRAIEELRQATQIPTADRESEQARFTHLTNLGQMLQSAGHLEEAETTHRESVRGRARHYGEAHAGYAFGLEGLGQALVAHERWDEAERVIDQAIEILRANGHPRIGALIGLRACMRLARNPEMPSPLEPISSSDPEVLLELSTAASIARELDPVHWAPVAPHIVSIIARRQGAGRSETLSAAWLSVELASLAEDTAARVRAARQLVDVADASGERVARVESRLELAFAEDLAGSAAHATYEAAIRLASEAPPASHAHALREFGLHLESRGDTARARERLEDALVLARTAGDEPTRMWGRVSVALGIFKQHHGEDGAIELLREGIAHLPETHADSLIAQSHLRSAERGEPCDCERDMPVVIHEMLLGTMRAAGGDLVEDIERQDDAWNVRYTREPSPEERASIETTLRHAISDLRRSSIGLYGRSSQEH
jgi:tetratricopeptide (TPR) repeat protein